MLYIRYIIIWNSPVGKSDKIIYNIYFLFIYRLEFALYQKSETWSLSTRSRNIYRLTYQNPKYLKPNTCQLEIYIYPIYREQILINLEANTYFFVWKMRSRGHLRSTGEEGQQGIVSDKGWQLSLRKSLQQNTSSLFWLKLVPYLAGEAISFDMYFDLSSKGSSKNILLRSVILKIASSATPWFINCINQKID